MATELQQSQDELFALFLARARRVALLQGVLRAVLRGLIASAICTFAAIRLAPVLGIGLAAGMLISCVFGAGVCGADLVWLFRRIRRIAETLDRELAADGKILGAAEFLDDACSDPFKRLAVAETGAWLASRPDAVRPWKWPAEAWFLPLAVAAACIAYFGRE